MIHSAENDAGYTDPRCGCTANDALHRTTCDYWPLPVVCKCQPQDRAHQPGSTAWCVYPPGQDQPFGVPESHLLTAFNEALDSDIPPGSDPS